LPLGRGIFPAMKALVPSVLMLAFAGSLPLHAQAVPATPKKFETRRIGEAASGGASVNVVPTRPQTSVRTVTHIVLGEPRQWKLSNGKFYVGKLIAFEDIVVEGNAAGAAPVLPKNPTVMREGRVRLLVNAKPVEVQFDHFADEERKLILEMRTALEAKK
jgi:hypothetical protein